MKFEELNLKPELLKAITQLGFVEATEIQAKCIPEIMTGKDIVGQSQTGSGKTAAFGLPMLQNIVPGRGVQAIILTPTRELCVQVHDTLKLISKYLPIRYACVYGGVGIGPQIDDLRRADIVVGTPGRTMDHLDRRSLDISHIKYFVLDEADKMLEMGFIDDIRLILKSTPKTKQSLMFSATMPTDIKKIISQFFNNPTHIRGQMQVDRSLLKQVYYSIQQNEKFPLLVHFLKLHKGISIIFCATRHEVDLVTDNLDRNGIKAMAIHGGLTQGKRLQVVEMLRKEHITALVATDVAARGLDIRNITHIFNYDLPRTPDEYIHRIGRTARAGETGVAITLLTHADYDKFGKIQRDRTLNIVRENIPAFQPVPFTRGQSRSGSQGGRPPMRQFGRGRSGGQGRAPQRGGGGFRGGGRR